MEESEWEGERHYFAFSFSNERSTTVKCKAAKLYGFLEHDNQHDRQREGTIERTQAKSFPLFFSNFFGINNLVSFFPIYISNLL